MVYLAESALQQIHKRAERTLRLFPHCAGPGRSTTDAGQQAGPSNIGHTRRTLDAAIPERLEELRITVNRAE